MTFVFVYGTLKRGGTNHSLLVGQRYLGDVLTRTGYTLYSMGDYPGMVRTPDDTSGVSGELWSVDDDCLAELDRLEGIDEGLYERSDILLAPNPWARSAQSYLYLRPHHGLPAIGPYWPMSPPT